MIVFTNFSIIPISGNRSRIITLKTVFKRAMLTMLIVRSITAKWNTAFAGCRLPPRAPLGYLMRRSQNSASHQIHTEQEQGDSAQQFNNFYNTHKKTFLNSNHPRSNRAFGFKNQISCCSFIINLNCMPRLSAAFRHSTILLMNISK